jgi:hypothetical protein
MRLITLVALTSIAFSTHAIAGGKIKHLPDAPSWDYQIQGSVKAGPVGSDFCDLMGTGMGCQGVNILIEGPAAQAIFNNLTAESVNGTRRGRGIECSISTDGLSWKCLLHVKGQSVGAGELPWISD